jgi:hypothetical protein
MQGNISTKIFRSTSPEIRIKNNGMIEREAGRLTDWYLSILEK